MARGFNPWDGAEEMLIFPGLPLIFCSHAGSAAHLLDMNSGTKQPEEILKDS
jgi:hypothetical protein